MAAQKANVDQTAFYANPNWHDSAAQVEANQALFDSAKLNLRIRDDTRADQRTHRRQLIPVGGLVTQDSAQPLTTTRAARSDLGALQSQ